MERMDLYTSIFTVFTSILLWYSFKIIDFSYLMNLSSNKMAHGISIRHLLNPIKFKAIETQQFFGKKLQILVRLRYQQQEEP